MAIEATLGALVKADSLLEKGYDAYNSAANHCTTVYRSLPTASAVYKTAASYLPTTGGGAGVGEALEDRITRLEGEVKSAALACGLKGTEEEMTARLDAVHAVEAELKAAKEELAEEVESGEVNTAVLDNYVKWDLSGPKDVIEVSSLVKGARTSEKAVQKGASAAAKEVEEEKEIDSDDVSDRSVDMTPTERDLAHELSQMDKDDTALISVGFNKQLIGRVAEEFSEPKGKAKVVVVGGHANFRATANKMAVTLGDYGYISGVNGPEFRFGNGVRVSLVRSEDNPFLSPTEEVVSIEDRIVQLNKDGADIRFAFEGKSQFQECVERVEA